VTGSVLGERPDLAVSHLVETEYSFHRGWKVLSFPGTTGTKWSPLDIWRVGVGGTMAWRRTVLDRIRGFDPALGAGTPAGSCEDIDAFRRALISGITIRYQPSALVWHTHPEHLAELRQMLVRYGITLGAHAMKMALEEGCWRALVFLGIDSYHQIAWAARLFASRMHKEQLRMPAGALLLQPPSALLGMVRFVRYRGRLRRGESLGMLPGPPRPHHRGPPPNSGIIATEIELTQKVVDRPVESPTWLLVRLQRRPVARVLVPRGQTIFSALDAQLEDSLRQHLHIVS
jgi:hypothetical protein